MTCGARTWRRLTLLCGALAVNLVLSTGCTTLPPPSRTTLVLLPDEDGQVGSATLSTAHGRETLDQAFSATSASDRALAPGAARGLGRDSVDARYAGILAAQPPAPRSFTLHFLLDRAVLTDASRALLPELLRAAKERKPTEISVFGHADASGTRERNQRLSAERAQVVADWLRQGDPSLDRIDVRGFGSAELLGDPGVRPNDPRHRRVEVLIL